MICPDSPSSQGTGLLYNLNGILEREMQNVHMFASLPEFLARPQDMHTGHILSASRQHWVHYRQTHAFMLKPTGLPDIRKDELFSQDFSRA